MQHKVLLISIDGMRPDGLKQCGHEFVKKLEAICAYTYNGLSVFPSITLPCHFSMTHSISPNTHEILSNIYNPQVRLIKGIFEKVHESGKTSAFFYGWENLRDIALPGTLKFSCYINANIEEFTDTILTNYCDNILEKYKPDFAFLYLVDTDEKGGHNHGWMSVEYKKRISIAIDNVKKMFEKYGHEYNIIIISDHGGHDRSHGTRCKEDMTIPFFFYGKNFKVGEIKEELSLLDIAPTIAKLLNIEKEREWEGKSII